MSLVSIEVHQNLTPEDPEKDVYALQLMSESPLNYEPGDWLLVEVENQLELVAQILTELKLSPQTLVELRRKGQVTLQEALHKHLEITQLNPAILNKCQRAFGWAHWPDRQAMMDYAKGRDVLDLLKAFPQLIEHAETFIGFLSPLAPRYYSISSSRAEVGDYRVDILFKHVAYETHGRVKQGVATEFLKQKIPGDVLSVSFSSNPTFKLPDAQTPIIMLGAGTGVAPFISFCQQRFQTSEALADTWLFFGETHQKSSFLFEDSLKAWQQRGLQLRTAFSRDQAEKCYVQHQLIQEKAKVWALLQQGANLYVCGDKDHLMDAIDAALIEILTEYGQENAPEMLKEWKKQRRIQTDVY